MTPQGGRVALRAQIELGAVRTLRDSGSVRLYCLRKESPNLGRHV